MAINRQVDRARLEHFGSGVLVRFERLCLLLSAAHVLVKDRLWLPGKPSMPLNDAGRVVSTTPFDGTPHVDSVDIGYVVLTEAAVTALTALGRTFLPHTEVVSAQLPLRTAAVTFVGMPCSKSKTIVGRQEIITTPTYIRTDALAADELAVLKRPNTHVGIRYHRKKLMDDATGKRVNGPIPDGMSGGPIWLILPDGMPKLWAIGTDYDLEKGVLFGTKLQSFLPHLLKREFGPDFTLSFTDP